MSRKLMVAIVCALVLGSTAVAGADDDDGDRSRVFNVLPPGQSGGLPTDVHSTDQIPLYDGLTPLFDQVGAADIEKYFKPEILGLGDEAGTVEPTPRPGLRLVRDSYGVPHIFGDQRADVMYGAGWAAAHDRALLLEVIRGPARIAALDVPGLDAFSLALSLRQFEPSAQTEQFLDAQRVRLLDEFGERGREVLVDVDAYLEGLNGYYQATGNPARPWTRNDVLATNALIGAVFGKGGGGEVRNAEFLARFRAQFGAEDGDEIFRDLRRAHDPEAPTTITKSFPYLPEASGDTPGSAVVDPGSVQSVTALTPLRQMSNALVVDRSRSATHNPLAVMGPQVGYYYPEILMEQDLHGGGIDARGVAFPGISLYVLLGRGKDFAWSATSSGSDNIDQYLEELCNADGTPPTRASTHYLHNGECVPMTTFDAGLLRAGGGEPDQQVSFRETVHGPVSGTATVGGKFYAITTKRSTRGREPASALAFRDLNNNDVDARRFDSVMNQVEYTFNWFYVDDEHVAYFSSGRLPKRARGTNPDLPTLGTGKYEWRGFLSRDEHPQAVDPDAGLLLNWNNSPAPGWGAADDNWGYGPIDHVDLFEPFARRDNRLEDVVGVMNKAATQDVRAVLVWPVISRVLATGPPPDALTGRAAQLLDDWVARGGSRLDRNLDGLIDHPGAAILDRAWTPLRKAVLRPVLGDLVNQIPTSGWDDYVDKDLRTLLDDDVKGELSRGYCGNGDLDVCRNDLWAALKRNVDRFASERGPNPSLWLKDATGERIRFAPGLLPNTMRASNRPTFQQVVEFDD